MAKRRRMGQELKDFTSAFLQGYKIFSDSDRRGGRSSDPYSDENLAKNDSRLGGGGFFSKLFGGGDETLTGADRGRAAIDAQMRIAIERGDYKRLEELTQGAKKFELLTKNPLVGEKPGEEPKAAIPAPRAPDRRSDATPVLGGDRKVVALNDTDKKDEEETTEENSLQPQPFQTAQLEEEEAPDWSSSEPVFIGATGGMVQSIFSASGGMVPTQYAALGGSMTSRTGDTGGLEGERGEPRSAIPLQADDEPQGYYAGDPEDIRDPEEEEGTPVRPMGPAVTPEQAPNTAQGKSLDLPTNPQELAGVAARAVKAGLDRINDEFRGEGALGTPSPNRAALVKSFANSEGRFSDEEVAQLDKIIDPDGKLPPNIKSAARIAAIYKFYEDDGDPETARNAAARMLLYNKNLSQRLGAEALEAFQKGDMQTGIDRLTSAYNDTLPDGQQIRAAVNKDGSVTYSVGYERDGEWVETQGGRTDKNGLIQLASNTARSDEYMQRLYAITESLKNAKRGGAGTGAATGASSKDILGGIDGVRTAAEALKAARADGDPDKIAQAEANLRASQQTLMDLPYHKTRNGDTRTEIAGRQTLINNTIKSILGPGGSASGAPRSGGSVGERAEATNERALADLRRKRQALDDVRVSPFESQDEIDLRRRQLEEIDQEIAGIGSRTVKPNDRAKKEPRERAEPYMSALLGEPELDDKERPIRDKDGRIKRVGGILSEAVVTKSGKTDKATLPRQMSRSEEEAFENIFARIGHLNDGVTPTTLARKLYAMTFATDGPQPKVDPRDGSIIYDGERLFIDKLSMQQMAAMRQAEIRKAAARETKAARDRNAREEEARNEQAEIARREEERKTAIKSMQDKVDAGTATTGPFSETNAVQGARAIGGHLKRMEEFNLRRRQMMQERAIGGE